MKRIGSISLPMSPFPQGSTIQCQDRPPRPMISSTGKSESIVPSFPRCIDCSPRGSLFSHLTQNTYGIGTVKCLGEAESRTERWRLRYKGLELNRGPLILILVSWTTSGDLPTSSLGDCVCRPLVRGHVKVLNTSSPLWLVSHAHSPQMASVSLCRWLARPPADSAGLREGIQIRVFQGTTLGNTNRKFSAPSHALQDWEKAKEVKNFSIKGTRGVELVHP